MQKLLIVAMTIIVLVAASTASYAWFGTYYGTALPAFPDWIPDNPFTDRSVYPPNPNDPTAGGNSVANFHDGDTYPGTDGYGASVPAPTSPFTYNMNVLQTYMTSPSCDANGYIASLGTSPEVSAGARFRVKYVNNMTQFGNAILSIYTKGASGISFAIADKDYDNPPDHSMSDRYWYMLDQFSLDSAFRVLTPITTLPLKTDILPWDPTTAKTYQTDWAYHEVWLYSNSTYGIAAAYFDGQVVWRGVLTDMKNSTDGMVEFGSSSTVQFNPGKGHQNKVNFDWVQVASGAAGPVTVPALCENIDAVKRAVDGAPVNLPNYVVSAAYLATDVDGSQIYDSFAVEAKNDRTNGIRVISPIYVNPGDVVTVRGGTAMVDGERVILPSAVDVMSPPVNPPKPLAMNNLASGGGACGAQGAVANNAAAPATMSAGLNNIGLYSTIFGTVTAVHGGPYSESFTDDYFYVDDGCGLQDGTGNTGIRCRAPSVWWLYSLMPGQGQHIAVRGTMGVRAVNGVNTRLFWTWDWNAF